MRIDIITIFPKMFGPILNESIVKRAQHKGKVRISVCDLRDHTLDKHRKVDDRPFGGGSGMVMTPEPIFKAV
jgi:tRNA (guanine37-N1)-methyltransferase